MAVHFRRIDVDKMLTEITAKQFSGWIAYYSLEPFGHVRDDLHRAMSLQMMHNLAVDAKYRKPLKDFILKLGEQEEPTKPQTWQEQLTIVKAFVEAHNAQFIATTYTETP